MPPEGFADEGLREGEGRQERPRDQLGEGGGEPHEPPVAHHVRGASRRAERLEPGPRKHPLEVGGRTHGLRSALEHEFAVAPGLDRAAGARCDLEHDHVASLLHELGGAGQPRDPGADDDDLRLHRQTVRE